MRTFFVMILLGCLLQAALSLGLVHLGGIFLLRVDESPQEDSPPVAGRNRLLGIALCGASLCIGFLACLGLARLIGGPAPGGDMLALSIGIVFSPVWAACLILGLRRRGSLARAVARSAILLVLFLVFRDGKLTGADAVPLLGLTAWLAATALRARRSAK